MLGYVSKLCLSFISYRKLWHSTQRSELTLRVKEVRGENGFIPDVSLFLGLFYPYIRANAIEDLKVLAVSFPEDGKLTEFASSPMTAVCSVSTTLTPPPPSTHFFISFIHFVNCELHFDGRSVWLALCERKSKWS